MSQEFESRGKVVTVKAEIKTKSYTDAKGNVTNGEYIVCTVLHTTGPIKGTTYFAQRTLLNKEGVRKSPVNVGDEVTLYNRVMEDANGKNLFSTISAGAQVDNIDDIFAMLASPASVGAQAIN